MNRRRFLLATPMMAAGLANGAATASSDAAETRLVAASEPGKPLVVSGTIYAADGVTPARSVRLFLYHTDAEGYYSRPRDNPRDARIRGWVMADERGRYRFRTIKPAHYANNQGNAAHIHTHLHGPDMPAHWIDSFLFAGDRYLHPQQVAEGQRMGALSPVMQISERGGVLYCTRDIRINPALFERNRLVDGWYRN